MNTPSSLAARRGRGRGRGVALLGIVAALAAGLLSATDVPRRLWNDDQEALDEAVTRLVRQSESLSPAEEARTDEPPDALRGSPEARLIAVYRLVGRGRLDEALAGSGALVAELPHFRLAQLVHADLLAAKAGALRAWGGGQAGEPGREPGGELGGLLAEAQQRLAGLRARPPADAVPREFAHLPPHVPYAIAVDASQSRLYLFRNGPTGIRLEQDFYVSVGKQGVDKLVEGDQRTPLGIYFVTQQLDPRALEDRFGAGALPLNYPNAFDKARGRTGSGILLHGVPAATYARPPLDSDGCVVLANPDLLSLARRLPARDTPVLISRQISWVSPRAVETELPSGFTRALRDWTHARQAADGTRLAAFYSRDSNLDRPARARLQAPAPARVDETSLIRWGDEQELMVVTFRERAGRSIADEHVMRQYWARQGEDWRILAEGQVR